MDTKVMSQFDVLDENTLVTVEGGWGYVWQCSNKYKSAWHAQRRTAQENANAYMRIHRGVVCAVFNA